MPKARDVAGSSRARMRLVVVVLLGLVTGYLVVNAFALMLVPGTLIGAANAVWFGVAVLAVAVLYGFSAWWVARRVRRGHIVAIVVAALGFVLSFGTVTGVLMWVAIVVQVAAIVLLALTVPQPRAD